MSIVAVDFGSRRIGIAVSESGVLATPHSVIANSPEAAARVAAIGAGIDADLFVVGIPRRAHAAVNDERFRRFADELRQQSCKQVVLWDEALTTVEAESRLRSSRGHRRAKSDDIDMYAAAVILEAYLSERSRRKS